MCESFNCDSVDNNMCESFNYDSVDNNMCESSISQHPNPTPPHYVKMPGRLRKERRSDASEPRKPAKMSKVGMIIRCKLCRNTRHNTRGCPLNPNNAKKANNAARRKKPIKGKEPAGDVGKSSRKITKGYGVLQTKVASTQQSTSSTLVQVATPNKRQRLF